MRNFQWISVLQQKRFGKMCSIFNAWRCEFSVSLRSEIWTSHLKVYIWMEFAWSEAFSYLFGLKITLFTSHITNWAEQYFANESADHSNSYFMLAKNILPDDSKQFFFPQLLQRVAWHRGLCLQKIPDSIPGHASGFIALCPCNFLCCFRERPLYHATIGRLYVIQWSSLVF